jgi:beta-hydroxylase
MTAFRDPKDFAFVPRLEAAFPQILVELAQLADDDFVASPDSLTMATDGYDETGWRWFALVDDGGVANTNAAHCPDTVRACRDIPGLVNAGFSLFRPGTHLYPHQGERNGVLRCHLPLRVPAGDVALRFCDEVRHWTPGRCIVFDDRFLHEAWNHGDGDRVVLLVTFAAR